MHAEEIIEKAKELKNKREFTEPTQKALQLQKEFLKLYPYREHPEEIDLLDPQKLYSPGKENYFFLWIEHKLRGLGTIAIGSAKVGRMRGIK